MDNAVVTARDAVKVQDLVDAYPNTGLALALDVTDDAQVTDAVQQARGAFRRPERAGQQRRVRVPGRVEEGEEADVARLFATNFFGPVAMIKAVLPGMRGRRDGAIVNISSIGARISPPGSGTTRRPRPLWRRCRHRCGRSWKPLGITVTVVEPGGFRTDFAGRSLQQSRDAIADYADTAGRRRKEHDTAHGTQPGDPARAAQAIITAVEAPDSPFLLLLGKDAPCGSGP